MKKRLTAFSLMELMVTLVIVGILATLAWPSYRHHLERAHAEQAKTTLRSIASRLEYYYLQHQQYTGATIENLGEKKTDGHYDYILEINNNSYVLTATDHNTSTCSVITLNALGAIHGCG